MKKLIFLFVVLATISLSAQKTFEGIGNQKNDGSTWEFTMKLKDNGDFEVVYPSLQCSSVWKFKKTDHEYRIYQEKLRTGFDKCVNDGFIYITDNFSGSGTQYFYIYEKIGDKFDTASGTIDEIEE